jgi:adenylylsulfate kinase
MTESHKAYVYWFSGLSGAGKSTIGAELLKKLKAKNLRVQLLDGDEIRDIFPATGFDDQSRKDHLKRIAHLAAILQKHNVNVIVTTISPFQESRDFARKICANFVEIYVSTPLNICEERDVKGLYKKARKGEIKSFTGIDSEFQVPIKPELILNTSEAIPDVLADRIIKFCL